MVLVSRKNRKTILEYLFKEGVLTVQKDGMKPKHDQIDVPNLHVMMVMKSLTSLGHVKEKFNWQWYYYFLKDEGIQYLREVLHLPATVMPATLTKQTRQARPGAPRPDDEDRERKGKGKGKGKGGKGKKGGWTSSKGQEGYAGEAAKEEAAPAQE